MGIDVGLRHLRAAVAVADAGSFTGAARQVHLAQSSLSRTVLELEQRLGVPLFERSTRAVRPTLDGEEFLSVARRLLGEFDAALGQFQGYLAGVRGSISIAALPSLAATLLPPVISAFRSTRPDVTVAVQDGFSGDVLDLVLTGAVDMAVTVSPNGPPALRVEHIAADEFACVFPPGHRFEELDHVGWSDLDGEDFVSFDHTSSIRAYTDRVLRDRGIVLGTQMEARNIGAVAGLVGAGLGVTVAPGLVLPMMHFADLRTRSLVAPVVERKICLVHHADRPRSPAAGALMHLLVHAQSRGLDLPDRVRWTVPGHRL